MDVAAIIGKKNHWRCKRNIAWINRRFIYDTKGWRMHGHLIIAVNLSQMLNADHTATLIKRLA